MATQGPLFPSAAVNNSVAPENTDAWVNPTNVFSDNATESTITAASFDSPDISQQLVTSGYGFTIPAGATIDGITVEIDRRSIVLNSGVDNRVQLRNDLGALVGANKATATVWPTASTVATYGGAADTWTATPTVAMVNSAAFGVVLSAKANIANADIGVDFIRVTITYTPAASVDADAEVAWTELEVPNADADAEISWAELEVPTADARADISWAELEVPNADARADVAWTEFEVPEATVDANAEMAWCEFEVPDPLVDANAEIAWVELEVPQADANAEVAYAEFETPNADAAAAVAWCEFECPDGPVDANAEVAYAEFEAPDSEPPPPPEQADREWITDWAAGINDGDSTCRNPMHNHYPRYAHQSESTTRWDPNRDEEHPN